MAGSGAEAAWTELCFVFKAGNGCYDASRGKQALDQQTADMFHDCMYDIISYDKSV